jgi:type IV pilus assembly protein PilV
VLKTLPGAMANPPTVVIVSSGAATLTPTSIVTITIFWQAPNDTTVHNYIAQAQIGG